MPCISNIRKEHNVLKTTNTNFPVYLRVSAMSAMVALSGFGRDTVSAAALKVNGMIEAANADARPAFSWKMAADRDGAAQAAYRIEVKDDAGAVVWDSGEVADSHSVEVVYDGAELKDARRYSWSVRVKDEIGKWTDKAESFFETGVVSSNVWAKSKFITPSKTNDFDTAAFVKKIKNAKRVKSAWWSVTGLGVFEAYVNGEEVSRKRGFDFQKDFLKPGYTHVLKRRHSYTYDITHLVNTAAGAENIFGAEVSQGWWRDKIILVRNGSTNLRGKESAFRAILILRYDDGTEETIGTDETWNSSYTGPILTAAIYDGEIYDARVPVEWRKTGLTDDSWGESKVNEEFKGEIVPVRGPAVTLRRDLALKPVDITRLEGVAKRPFDKWIDNSVTNGFAPPVAVITDRYTDRRPFWMRVGDTIVVDFGQNCAAVPEFTFKGHAGMTIEAKVGEILNGHNWAQSGYDGPQWTVYRMNYRGTKCAISYTFKDDAEVTYRPSHTFYGYRYLQLSVKGGKPKETVTVRRIRSIPVTSVHADAETGRVKSSNDDLNAIISAAVWGMYSNYLSVPTDCPQRNERAGWSADTQVFTAAALRAADMREFLLKWMEDMRDTQLESGAFAQVAPIGPFTPQGPQVGWADAGVIVPWTLWKKSGSLRAIRENWAAMERFMNLLEKTEYAWDGARYTYSDWLAMEKHSRQARNYTGGWGRWRQDKPAQIYRDYLGYCYWLWDARRMAEMADAIGEKGSAAKYRQIADKALSRIREKYLEKDGLLLNDFRDMQTPNLFALMLGIFNDASKTEATRKQLIENIHAKDGRLQTGFLGTSILMDTLTYDAKSPETAYALFFQRKCPSWLYCIDNGGTTFWERWDALELGQWKGLSDRQGGMNSFNHYAYGAVMDWVYGTVAGIRADPSGAGYKKVILAPIPDPRIGEIDCEFDSPYGIIRSAWKYRDDGVWEWRVSLPANVTADVRLPWAEGKRVVKTGTSRDFTVMVN